MRLVRDLTEDDMVEAFVLGELDSPLYGAQYAGAVFGDLTLYEGECRHAKALRKLALALVRGYGVNQFLFAGFPFDASWKLMAVPIRELEGWLYVGRVEGWLALSKDSRKVGDGAANVGNVPGVEERSNSILAIENAVKSGTKYRPLIAAAVSETSPHILIEGHTRATAFVRALNPDDEVEVIVGYSAGLPAWTYYGTP
jgi:hypothetical protein